ncbi:MAG: ATP-binding protein, partial [Pedobacter sp.]|nr:ATP-binding protein [Pedobacter sp.]
MLIKTYGSAVFGVNAITITIEVSIGSGNKYHIVGLPDNAIKESLRRVESAIQSSGLRMPRQKIVVNLSPADIRKEGTAYDLPIAIGILAASGQIISKDADQYFIMGELSLDGGLQPMKGVLPIAIEALRAGFKGFILPASNAIEAAIVGGLTIYGMKNLAEVISFFNGKQLFEPVIVNTADEFLKNSSNYDQDFSDVKGQESIKRALEIAAAGGHNLILIGPP